MLEVISKILDKINHKFEFIDLGGGMGIPYDDKNKKLNYRKYKLAIIEKFLQKHKSKIIFEPGRSISRQYRGILISKVIYIKKKWIKKFCHFRCCYE